MLHSKVSVGGALQGGSHQRESSHLRVFDGAWYVFLKEPGHSQSSLPLSLGNACFAGGSPRDVTRWNSRGR